MLKNTNIVLVHVNSKYTLRESKKRKESKFPIKEWEKAKRKERKFPIKEWEKEKKKRKKEEEEGKKAADQGSKENIRNV